MHVLVTGHCGYIGAKLVPLLLEHGHDVTGLDTDLYRDCTYIGGLIRVPSIDKDIRDVAREDLKGFDAVIHLAGLSNDPLGDLDAELTNAINGEASLKLAQTARQAGVKRFLFASSCSVYGESGEGFLDEESAFRPVTPYGASKAFVERVVSRLADNDFSPTYLRASTAYGLSPRIRFDLVLNNLVAWAVTTGRILLKSDGTPWRPLVHVEDIARAYVAVLMSERDAVHNRAFNVGLTTENYQVKELAQIVKEVVPGCNLEFATGAGPDKRCYRADCNQLATTIPSFKPQWTARRGAEELYQAFSEGGLTPAEFEGSRFSRVAHIRHLLAEGVLDSELRWQNDH